MLKPGDEAKIGGRPITGVSVPNGWVRSTTLSLPAFSSSTSWVRTFDMPRSFFVNG
jgi:hypothetical protein